jgi:16S rRNA (uracil1498-N3)-methyltransferase
MTEFFKLPRLYVNHALEESAEVSLSSDQAHYLLTVLRRKNEDQIRLFNGQEGEWLGVLHIQNKKSATVTIQQKIKAQPLSDRRIHLFFAPIKKQRMDWLIEKAVELGTTDFHPVLTQNTETRKINTGRIEKQIFEAAEQCERLKIPKLHPLSSLFTTLDRLGTQASFSIYACLERADAPPLQNFSPNRSSYGLLIGPEGGFTQDEKTKISAHKAVQTVSLGETVLRCETAAVKALILSQ